MQLTSPRGSFIEKVVRDAQGRLVRATFCVYEHGGRIKARLVSAVVLKNVLEENISGNKTLSLNGHISTQTASSEISVTHSIVSPYFNSSLIQTSGSKPRAPTHQNSIFNF